MKRFAIICGIIAACLCASVNASAQYVNGPVERKGANFVDKNGSKLSDQQLIELVGNEVFDQTVVGARKQFKAGKKLIWGGVAGIGAGLVCAALTGMKINDAGYADTQTAIESDASIAALYLGTSALLSAGGSVASAGIVLKTIGKKRLNWVEDEANSAKNYTVNFGAAPSGIGLTLTF